MIVWRDILQTQPPVVDHHSRLMDHFKRMEDTGTDILLVAERGTIVGYVDQQSLMQQLIESEEKDVPLKYQVDVLKVPVDHPVEFYHNISVYLGIDSDGSIVGYSTSKEARHRINLLHLHQTNQIFNSAGIGIITTNARFEISFMNETAENILGLSRSFLLQRNYRTLWSGDGNLEEVLNGKQFVNVASTINFKQIIGNLSPLYENGRINGVVHIFYLREHLEEAVKELEFVRNLNEDLKAIYSSSNEQIIAVNPQGEIIRIAGTFLKDFWMVEQAEQLIGKNVRELEDEGIFQPNVVTECLTKKSKHTQVQKSKKGRKVLSVATPVYHGERLEKVVVISRDITEINQLKAELEIEKKKSDKYKQELQQLINRSQREKKLIYNSKVMERLVDEMKQIALVDSTVLLYGESGVGKEVFAQLIHDASQRAGKAFVRVNCGAIPENLIESELFGYEKGAFTGAGQNGKPGLFEMAHGGSIFLDEITELPLNMQVKLLRVLQEREVMRVGGVKNIKVDVRVIAATNKDIRQLIRENKFREDLYYRLNVIPVTIPPLREREEDIASLSFHFLKLFNESFHREKNLSKEALDVLESYHWPGNVRELQNVIERLVVTTREDVIAGSDVYAILYGEAREIKSGREQPLIQGIMPLKDAVEQVERQLIHLALKKYGTATKAAEVLGVSQATISRRVNKKASK